MPLIGSLAVRPLKAIGDGSDVNVSLWERDLDTGLAKLLIDREKELVFCGQHVVYRADVSAQLEIQRANSKSRKENIRFRIFPNMRIILRNLQQNFSGPFRIGSIGDAHRHFNAQDWVGQRPVDQCACYEIFVRDDEFTVVELQNGSGPNFDSGDLAGCITDRHNIAQPNRTLEQQNESSDKVCDHLLQTEANAHSHSSGDPLHLRPGDADLPESQQNPPKDEDVANGRGNRKAPAGFKIEPSQNSQLKESGHVTGGDERQGEHADCHDHVLQADAV